MNFSILRDGKGLSLAGVLVFVIFVSLSTVMIFSVLAYAEQSVNNSHHRRMAFLAIRKEIELNRYFYNQSSKFSNDNIQSREIEIVIDERNPAYVLDDIEGELEVMVSPSMKLYNFNFDTYPYWEIEYRCKWKEHKDGPDQYVYLKQLLLHNDE